MKKSIMVIMAIITSMAFFILFNAEKVNKIDDIQLFETRLEYTYEILMPSSVTNIEQENIYEIITKILKETNGNIYYDRVHNEGRVKYVYITDSSCYSKLKLSNGRFLETNEMDTNNYLSTKNNDEVNKVGTLAEFSGGLNFEIKTLKSMIDEGYFLDGYCNVTFKDSEGINRFIEKMSIYTDIGKISIEEKTDISMKSKINNITIILILNLIIMLLVLYNVIKTYKKIGVEKILGATSKEIWLDGIKNMAYRYVLIVIIVTTFMSLIMFKEYSVYFIEFIVKIILVYALELLVLMLICSIPYIYVSKIKVSDILKNRKPTKEMLIINFAVKIILLVILFVNISNAINSYKYASVKYVDSFGQWEQLDDYYSVPSLYRMPDYLNPSNAEFLQDQRAIYEVFNKDGGILADFSYYDWDNKTYMVETTGAKILEGNELRKKRIEVNPNYLEKYSVYDVEGNVVKIDENETDYIVLVPEKYKSSEKGILDIINLENGGQETLKENNKEIKIIWTKNEQKLFSMSLDINPRDGNTVIDPIISVLTLKNDRDFNYGVSLGIYKNPFKIKVPQGKDAKEYIKEVAKEYGYDKYITKIVSVNESLGAKKENLKNLIQNLLVLILIFGSVIILVVIQSIYFYFEQYKQTIAIRQLHGYIWSHKYQEYLIMSGFSWILIFIALVVSKSISLDILALISAIAIFIELLIVFFTLKYINNRKILKVIKGDG